MFDKIQFKNSKIQNLQNQQISNQNLKNQNKIKIKIKTSDQDLESTFSIVYASIFEKAKTHEKQMKQ